ncbi:hypothetical protein BKA63DRAFT_201388 [Paraphoma chrysanthemicola]|nr:hypothetical protein BKA63DRAFT_201388 [Paraphoma chrysanthemicola]
MSNPPPISPPTITSNVPPATDGPISPVARSGTFPHKTSPAVATQTRLIDTSTPAINDAPVELDGVVLTHEDIKRRTTGGSTSGSVVLNPADDEDIDAEFLGEGENAGRGVREKRAAMLASRSKDPGVIVDVPQDPTAEEVEAAKSADGTITPGLKGKEFGGL